MRVEVGVGVRRVISGRMIELRMGEVPCIAGWKCEGSWWD